MKKVFWIFVVIGVVILIASRWIATNAYEFTEHALRTQGTVVELQQAESKRSSNKRRSSVYYPIVTFSTSDGQNITFRESVGTNPPAYEQGETVDVLYLPDNPNDARIKDWLSLWLLPTVFFSFGALSFLFGCIGLWIMRRNEKRRLNIMEQGERVLAKFDQVEYNASLKVNGRSPYRITCQWFDPMEPSKVYLFRSENIWFNPEMFIKENQQLDVYIDRKNPKKYHHVDISFLPGME